MQKHLLLLSIVAGSLFFPACKKDKETEIDKAAIISNIGNNVIIATYRDLNEKTILLARALDSLEANPTTANLTAARQAWVTARAPWEASEGFLFGPVDQEGIDPSLDSWPVNEVDLDAVLSSSNAITENDMRTQEGTLRGFHTIEYLLWGTSGSKAIGDFTAREFEYLGVCVNMMAEDTETLYNLWQPASGNYINQLLTAGQSGSIYTTQKSVLVEFINALTGIADEVANAKIKEPFDAQDLSLEESRFSTNSKADFVDNIKSLRNVYVGEYGTSGNGMGLSDIIANKDAALDTRFIQEIDAAIAAINAIPNTFGDAVFNNRAAITDAQTKVQTIQNTLVNNILPIISAL